jgi:hypothetical protein
MSLDRPLRAESTGNGKWAQGQPVRHITLRLNAHKAKEGVLIARVLMVVSAVIMLALGAAHLIYTFWGPMLTPRDPALQVSMSQVSPVITRETTMWRAWVGFNATHSMSLILFGLIYGFLAIGHSKLLFESPFLLIVGLAMLGGFLVLGKVYFFSIPFTGISISLVSYVASIALNRLSGRG